MKTCSKYCQEGWEWWRYEKMEEINNNHLKTRKIQFCGGCSWDWGRFAGVRLGRIKASWNAWWSVTEFKFSWSVGVIKEISKFSIEFCWKFRTIKFKYRSIEWIS